MTEQTEPADVGLLAAFPTPLLSDALDDFGIRSALAGFSAVGRHRNTVIGLAHTARFQRLDTIPESVRRGGTVGGPLETVLKTMQRGSFVVMDLQGAIDSAAWGGLASRIAQKRGVVGTVLNGACRDVMEITDLGYPMWSVAVCPRRSRNDFGLGGIGEALTITGVTIRQGDVIAADDSGIVCVPAERVSQVAERCADIAATEKRAETAIAADEASLNWDDV